MDKISSDCVSKNSTDSAKFDMLRKNGIIKTLFQKEELKIYEESKKAENPIRKIIGICLILLFVMGVGVMASNAKLYNVKIILSNGYIMNVTTSKTKVSEILDETT